MIGLLLRRYDLKLTGRSFHMSNELVEEPQGEWARYEDLLAAVERFEQIACDTKKAFFYSKDTGKWAWCDRDAVLELELVYRFGTRFEALLDAVEPYVMGSG